MKLGFHSSSASINDGCKSTLEPQTHTHMFKHIHINTHHPGPIHVDSGDLEHCFEIFSNAIGDLDGWSF